MGLLSLLAALVSLLCRLARRRVSCSTCVVGSVVFIFTFIIVFAVIANVTLGSC
jgi:hypothetical protein